jgi:hypothetical protein
MELCEGVVFGVDIGSEEVRENINIKTLVRLLD